jgi:hypothetical protein
MIQRRQVDATAFRPNATRLADGLMAVYYRLVEPLLTAGKKKRRLLACKCESLADVVTCPRMPVRFDERCIEGCATLTAHQERSIAKFLTVEDRKTFWLAGFACVPAVIRLERFPTFESYEWLVKKQSGGNLMREIQRARLSYSCRIIDRRFHAADIDDAANSMLVRTGGPMIAAILGRLFPSSQGKLDQVANLVSPPACSRHYRMDWGVFVRAGENGKDALTGKLVGYLFLHRVENSLRIMAFMGHRDYLPAGVMKLLFADVMKWVLDRQDEGAIGLDYLQYGAIEQGGVGLLDWKRRFGFEPGVFAHKISEQPVARINFACRGD